jgi:DNA polymerase-3 subunit gamma/tau
MRSTQSCYNGIIMGETKKTVQADNIALYRKYRSKSLDEIVGQEHITQTLKNAISKNKISHAYLFTGPRGTGKTSIARILAHEINQLPYTDDKPHLDIIEIDAASNRRIDDIRDLRDKVNIAPVSAKYKIYIIDEVHMLTTESFNALLKTLEEPPAHVVFILATTEAHKLPATIISRVQRHSFKFIPQQKVIDHLKQIAKAEGITINQGALELLAVHGGGSFRDSISLLDQLSATTEPIDEKVVELLFGLAPEDKLAKLIESTKSNDGAQIIAQIEDLLEFGLTPSGIAAQLIAHIRNSIKSGEADSTTLSLLKELLHVHGAQFPQLRLESILLNAVPSAPIATVAKPAPLPQAAPVAAATAKQPKPAATKPEQPQPKPVEAAQPKVTAAPQPKPAVAQPVNTETTQATEELLESWPKILEETKIKNNSLYTVLRLATPEIENQELLLVFNFSFHQKKLEEPKYKAVISEVITNVTGVSVAIKTLVDKSRTSQNNTTAAAPATSDPAHASLISNVQDIMGGGEVVNV